MRPSRYLSLARRRWPVTLLLVAAGILLIGCNPASPYYTLDRASDLAVAIQGIYSLVLWLGAAVFIGVQVALVYAIVRYRRRPGDGIPRQVHGSTPLEIAWTIIPALILVVIAVPTIQTIFRTQIPGPVAGAEALTVRVIGHQFWWEVQYPSLNILTANEIHVPVGQPVDIQLETADVVHSFWAPRLGARRDLIPNKVNHIFFTPTEPDVYYAQCAEFCGIQHANMRLRVVVEPRDQYDQWVQEWQQIIAASPASSASAETPTGGAMSPNLPPPIGTPPSSELVQRGYQEFMTGACAGCHTIAGTPARGRVGPNLTRFGDRLTIAAGTLENTPENLARWLRNPQEVKPGNQMPNLRLSEEQVNALVAYLESLK